MNLTDRENDEYCKHCDDFHNPIEICKGGYVSSRNVLDKLLELTKLSLPEFKKRLEEFSENNISENNN